MINITIDSQHIHKIQLVSKKMKASDIVEMLYFLHKGIYAKLLMKQLQELMPAESFTKIMNMFNTMNKNANMLRTEDVLEDAKTPILGDEIES